MRRRRSEDGELVKKMKTSNKKYGGKLGRANEIGKREDEIRKRGKEIEEEKNARESDGTREREGEIWESWKDRKTEKKFGRGREQILK